MIRLSLCLLSCFVLVLGGFDPTSAESLAQGFYSSYTGEDFPGCELPASLFDSVDALADDLLQERSVELTLAHTAEVYEDAQALLASCHLSQITTGIYEWIHRNGWNALFEKLFVDAEVVEGTALKLISLVGEQEWVEVGQTIGSALAAVIPPKVESLPLQSTNFFQKLDNFTAGVFVGFESNTKKPVACLTTYNTTSLYFRNMSLVVEGCVHLFINDCKKIRDIVPDVIIHLQALVLSCKLESLWASILGLSDPTTWSQIVVAYYWNMATITAVWTDLLQSYMFTKYRQMGVDFGTIIRILLGFKLN